MNIDDSRLTNDELREMDARASYTESSSGQHGCDVTDLVRHVEYLNEQLEKATIEKVRECKHNWALLRLAGDIECTRIDEFFCTKCLKIAEKIREGK